MVHQRLLYLWSELISPEYMHTHSNTNHMDQCALRWAKAAGVQRGIEGLTYPFWKFGKNWYYEFRLALMWAWLENNFKIQKFPNI